MEIFKVRNPHQALPELADRIARLGIKRDSRDGEVVALPTPATICYEQPMERVVLWAERDANPFFHLFESLAFLAGRRDVKFLEQFVSSIKRFSDNGITFHGGYGYRWRKHFQKDQLNMVIDSLKKNPNCRRQVVAMWDAKVDLGRSGVDLPCNLAITFQVNHAGELDMVVYNRSNDAVMGAAGANVVHMSILQEYISRGVGIPLGKYWQVSSNMHAYTRDLKKLEPLALHAGDPYRSTPRCPYATGQVTMTPVIDLDTKTWQEDLSMWFRDPFKVGLRSGFFLRVATPMYAAHLAHKRKDYDGALNIIDSQMLGNGDWKLAAKEWLLRRKEKYENPLTTT